MGLEYPEDRTAIVSFEVYTDEPKKPRCRLATIGQEVKLNGPRIRHDYGQIVSVAVSKLTADLTEASEALLKLRVEGEPESACPTRRA